jgi:hypothetical protein
MSFIYTERVQHHSNKTWLEEDTNNQELPRAPPNYEASDESETIGGLRGRGSEWLCVDDKCV